MSSSVCNLPLDPSNTPSQRSSAKNNCLLVLRETARGVAIGGAIVAAVTFVASIIFGLIALSSPYMPIIGIVALSLVGFSALSGLITVVASVIFEVCNAKMKEKIATNVPWQFRPAF